MRVVAFALCAVFVVSCSRANTLSPLPGGTPNNAAEGLTDYAQIYRFKGGTTDGAGPAAELLALNGVLFGTTSQAGAKEAGTVFKVTTAGKERTLYGFGADGYSPQAGLIAVNGSLYGTTAGSPSSGYCSGVYCGTVFEVSTSGKERALHRFKGGTDGYSPSGALISVNGTLYGATWGGGSSSGCDGYGCGTIFEVTASGKERVLYRFKGSPDGEWPYGGLTDVNGALYGTTFLGGKYCISNDGCGTVFEVSTSGKEHVIYSFKDSGDGEAPAAGLIEFNGSLYGTTSEGGLSGCDSSCGTVFEVSTAGKERVLYRFRPEPDGNTPLAGLIAVNGVLFGTTSSGGRGCGSSGLGCGTVFKTTTSGNESVLYRFKGGDDGAWPRAGLVALKGVLYGTTYYGGATRGCGPSGCGTVYRILP